MERKDLLKELEALLSTRKEQPFIEHDGLSYHVNDIDLPTMTPRQGVKGVVKNRRWGSQVYIIGGVKVHF